MITAATLILATAVRQDVATGDSDDVVVRAVWAEDRLWMLTEQGRLQSLSAEETAPKEESIPDRGLDLALQDGVLHVLTLHTEPPDVWGVLRREEGTFRNVVTIAGAGDRPLRLTPSPTGLLLVTSCRLVELARDLAREVWFSDPLNEGLAGATTFADSESIHVGFDSGEYGGGLFRIDRSSGAVAEIHGVDAEDPAAHLLDRDYSTVNGIVPLPWEPGTLAVSCDEYDGKVFAVRGERVRVLYQEDSETEDGGQETSTLGLASADGSLLGVGLLGVFRIDPDGKVTKLPTPPTRKYGKIEASFALPGAVLIVRDDFGREYWPFGAHPLLVGR